ncbi:MAG: hypothetical protein M3R50_06230 [Bacteroidota bacterium]|nr:hypothetical protein [Bacteroidota bacterium]
MAQIMADVIGLPIDEVQIKLGDSIYPQCRGSWGLSNKLLLSYIKGRQ